MGRLVPHPVGITMAALSKAVGVTKPSLPIKAGSLYGEAAVAAAAAAATPVGAAPSDTRSIVGSRVGLARLMVVGQQKQGGQTRYPAEARP